MEELDMYGVSGYIFGVSEFQIVCPNFCPEYSSLYSEYLGFRLDVRTMVRSILVAELSQACFVVSISVDDD